MSQSTVLPIAYVMLRILIVLNIVVGLAILALLLLLPNADWIMSAFDIKPSPDTDRLIWGLRGVAAFGVLACVINHFILKNLAAMVTTVRIGDPFVAANAYRLNAIAWLLLAMQFVSLFIAAIGKMVSTPAHPVHLDAGFSINGWLAVILTFVLARVFAEGTLMREDLEGTV